MNDVIEGYILLNELILYYYTMRMRYIGIKTITTEGEPVRKEITAEMDFKNALREVIAECLGIPTEQITLSIRRYLLMACLLLIYGEQKTDTEINNMYYKWKDDEERINQLVKKLLALRRSFYFIYATYVFKDDRIEDTEGKGVLISITYRCLKIDVLFSNSSSNKNSSSNDSSKDSNNVITVTASLLRDYKGKAAGWIL